MISPAVGTQAALKRKEPSARPTGSSTIRLHCLIARAKRVVSPHGDSARRPHHDMLAEHHVGLGKALKKAIIDHGLRTFRRLFTGLEDRH